MVNKVWTINITQNSEWQWLLASVDNDIKNVCLNNRDEIEKILLESIRLIRKINKVPNKSESIVLLARLRKNYLWAKNRGDKELNDFIDIIINNPIF